MIFTEKKIFDLLPAVYRIRDVDQGNALKALIGVIAGEAKLMEEDIAKLYNNWFIETCEEWVVPYIGDLLGVRNFHAITGSSVISQRAYVANTLGYRRRKGIAPVLEQLSLDIAGWRGHAVEFFELLSATQYMNHTRLHRTVAPDLRNMDQLDLLNTAFDSIAHTADMRHISRGKGLYNISNIGLFIWRLQSYPVIRSDARALECLLSPPSSSVRYFTFDPCGLDCQLFNPPQTETAITHISEENNVPGLLRRRALYDELEARRQALVDGITPEFIYFDDRLAVEDEPETRKHPVFEIFPGGQDAPIPPEEILICSLEKCCTPPPVKTYRQLQPDGSYSDIDMSVSVAVDPLLGRFIFTDPLVSDAVVSYSYGFSADIGAGTYNRRTAPAVFLGKHLVDWQFGVSKSIPPMPGTIANDLQAAVDAWNLLPAGTVGLIVVMDNQTYEGNLDIVIKEKSRLLIVAADWPETIGPGNTPERKAGNVDATNLRPHLRGSISINGQGPNGPGSTDLNSKTGGELSLNGLLVEGALSITEGNLGVLNVANCTILPGNGGIGCGMDTSDPLSNQWLNIVLQNSICGPVNLNATSAVLFRAENCILDNAPGFTVLAPNTPAEIEQTTLFGKVHVKMLNAGNCLFTEMVKAERRQTGCIRFSFLPGKNPEVPRRFRCQPDLEITTAIAEAEKIAHLSNAMKQKIGDEIRDWLVPSFNSTKFGHHAYAQLKLTCPEQISGGADNGSEMGAFCLLQQPQRQANLRIALDEYMPFGLEAGIKYVT